MHEVVDLEICSELLMCRAVDHMRYVIILCSLRLHNCYAVCF